MVPLDFDAEIVAQMTNIITHLEDHDLAEAEERMRALLERVQITSPVPFSEQKLVDLRKRLQSGICDIERSNPLTAVIRFRKAFTVWQSSPKISSP